MGVPGFNVWFHSHADLGRQQIIVQVVGYLQPMWEIWTKLLAIGSNFSYSGSGGAKQQMGHLYLLNFDWKGEIKKPTVGVGLVVQWLGYP